MSYKLQLGSSCNIPDFEEISVDHSEGFGPVHSSNSASPVENHDCLGRYPHPLAPAVQELLETCGNLQFEIEIPVRMVFDVNVNKVSVHCFHKSSQIYVL